MTQPVCIKNLNLSFVFGLHNPKYYHMHIIEKSLQRTISLVTHCKGVKEHIAHLWPYLQYLHMCVCMNINFKAFKENCETAFLPLLR